MKDFISDSEMGVLEKAGKAKMPEQSSSDFISDDQMAALEKSGQATSAKKEGAGQAALESYGNTATLGYLPHLQAMAGKLMPDPSGGSDDELRAKGFSVPKSVGSYIKERDANLERQAGQKKDFPIAAGIGTAAGIVGGGLTIPGAALVKGGSLAVRAGKAALFGGAVGAVQNPGDVEGELSVMPNERLQNAAIGAAVGGVAQGAVEGFGKAAKKVGEILSGKAELKATRALGRPTPTQATKMAATGQDAKLGRTLLDEGAIPVLGTPGRIQGRVETLKEKAGKAVGELLDRAESEIALQEKAGTAPFGGFRRIGTEIEASSIDPTLKLSRGEMQSIGITPPKTVSGGLSAPYSKNNPGGMNAGRQKQARTDIDRANLAAVNESGFDPYGSNPEIEVSAVERGFKRGKAEVIGNVLEPKSGYRIDSVKLADSVRGSEDFARMSKIPGMEGAVSKIDGFLQTLERNGEEMTIKEALKLRQGIDESINFGKKSQDLGASEKTLYDIRNAIRDKMDDVIANAKVAEAGALKATNRKYGDLSTAGEILEKEVGRNQANRSVSLTDTIAGGAGLATGNGLVALAAGAANKAGRAFGNSIQARGFDAVAKQLAKVPAMTEMAASNPGKFQALVNRMATSMQEDPKVYKIEDDSILNDPEQLEMYRKQPALIDQVPDPRRRALIKEKLKRLPASK